MPLYGYECRDCGPFTEWAAMREASAPQPCPRCGKRARRTLACPHLRSGAALTRYKAEAHNERSANEPKVVNHVGHMGTHADRHAHDKNHHKRHSHAKHSKRPWMVGH